MPIETTELIHRQRPNSSFLSYILSASAIMLTSLICAFFMFDWVAEDQEQKAQARFDDLGQQVAISLERQIRRTEATLTSIVAFFAASDRVSRQQFHTFVSKAMSDQVGVQALEWIPRVSDEARAAYEHAAQADGLVNFAIRQTSDSGMRTASKRAEYYPVYYVEPLAGNEKAVGFDLASNPARKAALEQARDTGSIVSSARITLVQESAKQAGVVVFAPMYGSVETLDTVAQRRAALTGFALGVFRIGDLLESSVSEMIRANNLIIALYDASDNQNRQPLHLVGSEEADSGAPLEELFGEKSFQNMHKFGGRDWRLVLAPKGGNLLIAQPWFSWLAAIAVFMIVFLVGFYFQAIVRRRAFAEGLVIERTRDLEVLATDLAVSEERSSAVVANIVDGVISINDQGFIETVNSAVEQMFQYSAEELIGRNVSLLAAEPHQSVHDSYIANYLHTGEAKIIGIGREVEGQRKDGVTFPMELTIAEFSIHDRRIFLGVVRDITERKEMDRMKSEFVSTVSHELRTPLTSIQGSLGMVTTGALGEMPEQMRHMVDLAEKNTKRLINLVNDLLDIEKIQSGQMDFKFETLDITSLVEQALETNKPYADEHGVKFELAAPAVDAVVHGDAERLNQVMANLLSNAAKFSPEGGKVAILVERAEGGLRVSVTDHGPGIPKEFRDHIFERFTQADSSDTRQKGGTGLGLNISKTIVERHGGRIDFRTETGKGCTFFFEIPELTNQRAPPKDASAPAIGASPHHARVLVLEDDPDIAKLLSMMLEQGGFTVDVAHDAETAKRKLADSRYDVLTVDILLPDKNGIALINELRGHEETKDLAIVVVSVEASRTRDRIETSALGVLDWLDKPIDHDRLLDAVRRAVSQRCNGRPRILYVEDDADLVQVIASMIGDSVEIVRAPTVGEATSILRDERFDLVLLDVNLPDGSGLDLLPLLKNGGDATTPVIIFSVDVMDEDTAARVDAALVKSRTSNRELLETMMSLIAPAMKNQSMKNKS